MAKTTQSTIALVYDFDGTLASGNMQEFGFIRATGLTAKEFWDRNSEVSKEQDASEILCYMKLMIDEAKHAKMQLTRKSFQSFGANIELFKGVQEWFDLINLYGKERKNRTLYQFVWTCRDAGRDFYCPKN